MRYNLTLVIGLWSNPQGFDQIQDYENYRNHESEILVIVCFNVDDTSVKLRFREFVFHEETA